jgi:hypothetical protein
MKNTAVAAVEAITNIGLLAASAYNKESMTPTRRAGACVSKIAAINFQEVSDAIISEQLCDIHHCLVVRMERIERRAKQLLAS